MSNKYGLLDSELTAALTDSILADKNGKFGDATNIRRGIVLAITEQSETIPHPIGNDDDNPLDYLGSVHEPGKRAHYYLKRYWSQLRDICECATKVVGIGVA